MAARKDTVPAEISKAVNSIAKGLGIAAVELWSIFVRQYVVRGVAELFTAVLLCVASFFLFPYIGLWILVPLVAAVVLMYGTILLIGNPQYYAIEDIKNKVLEIKSENGRTSNYRGW